MKLTDMIKEMKDAASEHERRMRESVEFDNRLRLQAFLKMFSPYVDGFPEFVFHGVWDLEPPMKIPNGIKDYLIVCTTIVNDEKTLASFFTYCLFSTNTPILGNSTVFMFVSTDGLRNVFVHHPLNTGWENNIEVLYFINDEIERHKWHEQQEKNDNVSR